MGSVRTSYSILRDPGLREIARRYPHVAAKYGDSFRRVDDAHEAVRSLSERVRAITTPTRPSALPVRNPTPVVRPKPASERPNPSALPSSSRRSPVRPPVIRERTDSDSTNSELDHHPTPAAPKRTIHPSPVASSRTSSAQDRHSSSRSRSLSESSDADSMPSEPEFSDAESVSGEEEAPIVAPQLATRKPSPHKSHPEPVPFYQGHPPAYARTAAPKRRVPLMDRIRHIHRFDLEKYRQRPIVVVDSSSSDDDFFEREDSVSKRGIGQTAWTVSKYALGAAAIGALAYGAYHAYPSMMNNLWGTNPTNSQPTFGPELPRGFYSQPGFDPSTLEGSTSLEPLTTFTAPNSTLPDMPSYGYGPLFGNTSASFSSLDAPQTFSTGLVPYTADASVNAMCPAEEFTGSMQPFFSVPQPTCSAEGFTSSRLELDNPIMPSIDIKGLSDAEIASLQRNGFIGANGERYMLDCPSGTCLMPAADVTTASLGEASSTVATTSSSDLVALGQNPELSFLDQSSLPTGIDYRRLFARSGEPTLPFMRAAADVGSRDACALTLYKPSVAMESLALPPSVEPTTTPVSVGDLSAGSLSLPPQLALNPRSAPIVPAATTSQPPMMGPRPAPERLPTQLSFTTPTPTVLSDEEKIELATNNHNFLERAERTFLDYFYSSEEGVEYQGNKIRAYVRKPDSASVEGFVRQLEELEEELGSDSKLTKSVKEYLLDKAHVDSFHETTEDAGTTKTLFNLGNFRLWLKKIIRDQYAGLDSEQLKAVDAELKPEDPRVFTNPSALRRALEATL